MYKLLIVEDEYLLRSELALCEDWASMGFEPPLLAENGRQGLAFALAQTPDVVLTDIRMPQMDGLSMIQQIQAHRLHCLCIVLSGYDDFNYAVEELRYGVIDYLLKPVEEKRLKETLQRATELLSATDGTPEQPESGNLYLQKAAEYLQAHYTQDIRISDVAKELYISDEYLGRLFIKEYHMKFSDYLHHLRIRNAIPLLRDPKWKIYQIAQETGYHEQQYFCNVFKKMMGVSPYQFRHSIGIPSREDSE